MMLIESVSIWALVCFFVLLLVTLVLLGYYLLVFLKVGIYKPGQLNIQHFEPISVIIAARNEYKNLEKNLKTILEQDYPVFEVIVVNDCSWDDSQKLLEYYQEVYPHLQICKLVEQEKYPTGKKFALTIGIKAAKYQQLVFTDADCRPAGNQWLKYMADGFNQHKEIVLGHSPHVSKKGLLNLFIRFENALTALLYFGAAIQNRPFMGVGRNLAYTKSLFFKHKGFASHQHILSGDDDLFVNQAATKNNVAIQLNPQSFVFTDAKSTFDAYQRQKTRHISTGKYYKLKDKVFLGGYYFALILFYPALGLLFFLQPFWQVPALVFLIKWLVQTVVFFIACKKLQYKNIAWYLLLLDVLYFLYIIVFGFKGLINRKQKAW
jgi:cellulose synthase/poly-beta-1,6-N-acetylglucosamine synthase-like glycosyltransferase